MPNPDPACLVVGAGPVGLAMALELARFEVPFRLIERRPRPSALSKAIVVMPRTMEEFELRGLTDALAARSHRVNAFNVYTGRRLTMRVHYGSLRSRWNCLTHAPQTATEAVLTEAVVSRGGTVERDVELIGLRQDADGVSCTLGHADGSREELRTRWLVGCDGAHSRVRELLGIDYKGEQYPDCWALADVMVEMHYPRDQTLTCMGPEGNVAIFPMPEGRARIFVITNDESKIPAEVTTDFIQASLDHLTHFRTRVGDPRWMSRFHVHHRLAARYRVGRIFLAGDAAHQHSPESGLGMNTGIQDAFNLGWRLALVNAGRGPDGLLDAYHLERHAIGSRVVAMSHQAHQMAGQYGAVSSALRNRAMRLYHKVLHVYSKGLSDAMQLEYDYHAVNHAGIRNQDRHHAHGSGDAMAHPGRRLIDGPLWREDGSTTTVYGALAGSTAHQLVYFTGIHDAEPVARIRTIMELVANQPDLFKHHIIVADEAFAAYQGLPATLYGDPSLEVHGIYGAEEAAVWLVRPDGYLALRVHPMDVDAVRSYLGGLWEQ